MRYNLHLGPDNCYELYRVDENGTATLLGSDRGEPEDNSFLRDLAWVPEELNWLAGKITELQGERDEAIAQRNRWHRLVQIAQELNRKLETERNGYKEALQKSIANLNKRIKELKETPNA